ncbi:MAG: TauD/TfdA family dioxygenase [Arcobacteraceae bacterium]|nr:TauD/TfdA family dioxygenase [Arcobacteraceae bacterium]
MKVLEIELTDKEKNSLYNDLSKIIYPKDDYHSYIDKLRKVLNRYQFVFKEAILNSDLSYTAPHFYGGVKFKNLPIDCDIIMPPKDSRNYARIEKDTYISENVLVLIGLIFGEPYSMYLEGKGLVNNLIPDKNSQNDFTGLGSTVELGFHIENSALRFINKNNCTPKALLLGGVRQQEQPPFTPVSDVREALRLLSNQDIELLSKSNYKVKLPYRWRLNKEYSDYSTEYIPIINWEDNCLYSNGAFYGDMVVDVKNKAAKIALDNFIKALHQTMIKEVITPGEVICIDNRVVFHSRLAFDAKFDKNDKAFRWIQRIFITEDLSNFSDYKEYNNRVFALKA